MINNTIQWLDLKGHDFDPDTQASLKVTIKGIYDKVESAMGLVGITNFSWDGVEQKSLLVNFFVSSDDFVGLVLHDTATATVEQETVITTKALQVTVDDDDGVTLGLVTI